MVEDPQSRFLREFEKIKGIETRIAEIELTAEDINQQIRGIRGNYTKLSERIKTMEIQGLQDQISSISDTLLETQRFIAQTAISYEVFNAIYIVGRQKPKETATSIKNQLVTYAGKANTEIDTSSKPFEVVDEFRNTCYEVLRDIGVKLIRY